jgi:hypothetical protein
MSRDEQLRLPHDFLPDQPTRKLQRPDFLLHRVQEFADPRSSGIDVEGFLKGDQFRRGLIDGPLVVLLSLGDLLAVELLPASFFFFESQPFLVAAELLPRLPEVSGRRVIGGRSDFAIASSNRSRRSWSAFSSCSILALRCRISSRWENSGLAARSSRALA